jgi:8-oxo-dGTP pyrophosphatase MutT (NUDIX family)
MGGAAPWASFALASGPVTLARVRERFAGYVPPVVAPRPGARAAAVLVPVFDAVGEARVVLTRRPETMPSHRGDIAFPGGKVEPDLDVDARAAALREAEEEIGLPRAAVDVVAELPSVGTAVGQFVMTPFVGILDPKPQLVADSREVDRVFDVSLSELLDPEIYRSEVWQFWGEARLMHFFDLDDETVWGATARVLADFLAVLTGTVPPEPAW